MHICVYMYLYRCLHTYIYIYISVNQKSKYKHTHRFICKYECNGFRVFLFLRVYSSFKHERECGRKLLAKTLLRVTRKLTFSSVQSLSCVRHFATPWIAAHQASLSITNPGVHSDSRPSSQWCHSAISSSVIPFSSCPQSLQASESFPMSQLFAWGGQSTGVSALAPFLPKNTQDWSL